LLQRPSGRAKTRAIAFLSAAIVAGLAITAVFVSQPPSIYRHVF
jgi:hypothetical protein